MNWLIVTAVLVIGVSAWALRMPEELASRIRVHRVALETAQPAGREEHCVLAEAAVTLPKKSSTLAAIAMPTLLSEVDVEDRGLERERLLLQLETGLGLTPAQRVRFEEILMAREAEVEAYHAKIRASKVVWTWGYERRTREILAATQAQMTSVLSAQQVDRFYALYEERKVVDGISLEITPELTVIR